MCLLDIQQLTYIHFNVRGINFAAHILFCPSGFIQDTMFFKIFALKYTYYETVM